MVGEAVGARGASKADLWCRRGLGVRASGYVCLVFHFSCSVLFCSSAAVVRAQPMLGRASLGNPGRR